MSLSQASGTITSCSFSNFKNGALLLDGDAQCVVSLSNITFWNNSPAFPSFPSLQRNIECRGNIALNLSEFSSTTEEQVNLSSDDHVGTDVRPNNSAGSWIRSLECQLETDDSVDPQTSFFGPTVDTISVIDQNPFIIVVLSGTNLFPCDLSYVVFSAERLQIEDPKRNTETALKIGMTIDPAVFNHSTIVSSFTQSYLASNALNETAGEITLSPTAFPNDTVDYFVSLTMKVCDPQCRTFSPLPDAGYLVKIRIRDPNAYQMPPGLMWSLIGIGITIVVVGVVVVVILVAIRSRKKELARRKRIEEQQQKQRELEREKERQRKNRVHRKGSRRRSSDISDQRNVTLLNKELSMIAEEEEMVWEEDDEDGAERTEGTPKQRSRSNSVASRRASLTGDKKQEKWDNMSNLPSIPDTNSGNPNSHSLFQSNSDLPSAEVSNPSDVQSEWEEEGESEWEAESEWEDEEEYEWEEGEEGEQEPFDWSFLQNLPPQAQAYLDVTEKVMKEMFPDFSFASFFEKHGA
ncbi:hypothetical protein BLNAU_13322 [Blattamonas nauphoetae]|uniref:Uncharacterized protein n=1 Tax=Blattamonas nauphoetae TaxID=2049346 RepID=A0ABQ9XJS5_9EUKA|nr:hypothetical protein BLNAU_13322 [Blattamonas nauphoetae]